MFKRGYKRGIIYVLLLISSMGVFAQGSSSSRLSINNLNTIPTYIVDTIRYSLDIFVVNNDPSSPIIHPVSLYMTVDGTETVPLITNFVPPAPIPPGDSLEISLANYGFNPLLFSGGGITHDIIVWPMALGVQQSDTAFRHNVTYQFTQQYLSQNLGVTEPMDLPPNITQGQSYDLTVNVINQDQARSLLKPVTLYMSVNGDTPTVLADGINPVTPIEPGGIMPIHINNYMFDAKRFSGGGITHDIIVWPMAESVINSDSGEIIVSFTPNNPNQGLEKAASTFKSNSEDNGSITITWETEYEASDWKFNVRKKDDRGFFTSIFVIEGSGSGEEGSYYQVYDTEPSVGLNTYQLELQLGNGQNLTIAETKTYWTDPLGTRPTMTVMNNPFMDQFNLVITVPYAQRKAVEGYIEVYNLAGKPVYRQRKVIQPGKLELSIDLTDKPEGLYFYRVSVGEERFDGKVMKE